jgi:hypothetical protein
MMLPPYIQLFVLTFQNIVSRIFFEVVHLLNNDGYTTWQTQFIIW